MEGCTLLLHFFLSSNKDVLKSYINTFGSVDALCSAGG